MSDREFHQRNAEIARIASAHVASEHLEPVLVHLARSYSRAMQDGRMSSDDALTPAEIARHVRNIVAANPHVARVRPCAAKPQSCVEAQAAIRAKAPWKY